jgi:hypothetical protein
VIGEYPNIRVSAPGSDDPEEVTISLNPVNPLNLAAGANIDYSYFSFDGGYTWQQGNLSSTLGVYGDPCVRFDAQGNLYYAHLADPVNGDWLDRIVVQKSVDGGVTYDDGAGIGLNPPKDQDKEWLGVDMTDSPYRDNIYVAWTEFDDIGSSDPADSSRILFSRSTDSGSSWSDPVRISDRGGNCEDDDETVEGAVPAVGPGGEVYVSWSGPLGIMFDRSLDGGATFGEDIFVADQPGGWAFDVPGIFRCGGMPITACDVSESPFRGNVYVAWSDQRNGTDNTDVFFIASTDGGESWGDIVRVNDDTTAVHQFFPWMTVDPSTGIIYLVFYDRRNSSGVATDVYVARSEDGGQTFANFMVSESSFIPRSNVFFGDYIDIVAWNGLIYPIWMRLDYTRLSVWIAIIDESVGIEPVRDVPVARGFDLAQNFPNPFNPVTTIAFDLPRASMVNLAIYNVKGQRVETLVDGRREAGRHRVSWDGRGIASGVYFYRITTDDGSLVRKAVLLK